MLSHLCNGKIFFLSNGFFLMGPFFLSNFVNKDVSQNQVVVNIRLIIWFAFGNMKFAKGFHSIFYVACQMGHIILKE